MPTSTATDADTFRKLRKQAGLTQVELAIRAGVSRSAVQLLEAGYTAPGSMTRQKIEAVLRSLNEDGLAVPGEAVEDAGASAHEAE
jgi:transcriptional regulator with XRE-family HTH domain